MSLDSKEVAKIAHLARLNIAEGDVPRYAKDLSNFLMLVEQMQSVDTSNIEPLAHPLDAVQRLREDSVTEEDRWDVYQTIAPAVEAGLYLVPKVVE